MVPSSMDSRMEYLSRKPLSSSGPKVLNVPLPCSVLSIGVPVKPTIRRVRQRCHQVVPSAPPVVRWASSISTKTFSRVHRFGGMPSNLWIMET